MRAFLPILIFCGGLAQAAEDVVAVGTWMRAMPPGQSNSAAYTTLVNRSAEARSLVSVSSGAARAVEVHASRQRDGMWRMQRLERLGLPAGEKVVLSPGDIHLMVFGLAQSPRPGDEIPFELLLDNGEVVTAIAEVRSIGADTSSH